MSFAHNQLRVLRALWAGLQPLDRAAPRRLQAALADRRFGSRDRRFYRELLLTAVRLARALPDPAADEAAWAARLARACADTKETAAFRAAFAAPELVLPELAPLDLAPAWFAAECDTGRDPAEDAAALLARAPVWVRIQTDRPADVFAEWSERGWTALPHPALPDAWKLPPETDAASCETYRSGRYEIQDAGSQRILADLGLPARSPGPRWLDACAGAGGKTLQLARLLGPSARIDAADIRPRALDELRARAARAGLSARIRAIAPDAAGLGYDAVLVDAPCSGGGTWRRSPHLMACTTPADLADTARLQSALLDQNAPRVRPGGWLVYATCSIFRTENRAVTDAFLARHPEFSPLAPPATLPPGVEDNDGFYHAAFVRAG